MCLTIFLSLYAYEHSQKSLITFTKIWVFLAKHQKTKYYFLTNSHKNEKTNSNTNAIAIKKKSELKEKDSDSNLLWKRCKKKL